MRRWRRMVCLACATPVLAFAQGNDDEAAMTGGLDQQGPAARENRDVAPPDAIATDQNATLLVPDELPVAPPAPVERTYGRSDNPPGPGDQVRVRHNFSAELQQSAGDEGP